MFIYMYVLHMYVSISHFKKKKKAFQGQQDGEMDKSACPKA